MPADTTTARPMTEEFDDEDMAAVGRALMEAIHDNREHPALVGWMPMDSPVEVVVDLLNELDEAKAALLSTSSEVRRLRKALEGLVKLCRESKRDKSGNRVFVEARDMEFLLARADAALSVEEATS